MAGYSRRKSQHQPGVKLTIRNEHLLEDFLYKKNERGIVYIDLAKTETFCLESLSEEAQSMCKHDTNAGGRSQISEAFSYETFAIWGYTQLVKVSFTLRGPVFTVMCSPGVMCRKIVLLLKFLLFSTPSEGLTRDTD